MTDHEIDVSTFDELKQTAGKDFIGELVDAFLDEAPGLIAQLRSAQASGDVEAFRRAAHSLKSNGATFGAIKLSQQARELELLGKRGQLGSAVDLLDELAGTFRAVALELKELAA